MRLSLETLALDGLALLAFDIVYIAGFWPIFLGRGSTLPRYYFHLCAPDECFRDNIGAEVADLAAAHIRAVTLAQRVMTFGGLASCPPDLRRWTVRVFDNCHRSILTVIFPTDFAADIRPP